MAQKRLLLTRDQRLAALRAIDGRRLRRPDGSGRGVTLAQWRHVAEVLRQVELTTTADGCSYSYAETLAARMHNGAGVSRATFFRARALAESLGLLVAVKRWGATVGQQQSNEWRVDWIRVAALCDPIKECKPANLRPFETLGELPSETNSAGVAKPRTAVDPAADLPAFRKDETPPCQVETPPSQLATHAIGSVKSEINSLRSTVDASTETSDDRRPTTDQRPATTATRHASLAPRPVGDSEGVRHAEAVKRPHRRFCDVSPEAAHLAKSGLRLLANEYRIRPACDRDRSLIVKAAVVACSELSPNWFHVALGGAYLAAPGRAWGYLHRTLCNNAADLGFDFANALQSICIRRDVIEDVCRSAFTREAMTTETL